MSLTGQGKAAVAQLAARFVFDEQASAASQQDLAERIEAAISAFKASQMQQIIAHALRRELERHIEAAIDGWHRDHPPQPATPEPQDTPA
jgi:hypothetical protein